MADVENGQKSRKRKRSVKKTDRKKKKILVETATDKNSSKERKHTGTSASKTTVAHGKCRHTRDGISSKRKKHLHTKALTSEVVTENKDDLDEHTRLLSSVTGKMEHLPLQYEDGHDQVEGEKEGEEEEDEVTEHGTGDISEEKKGLDKYAAAQYLELWNSQRDKWTFRKKTQYWLLQNMFDR